MSWFPYFTRSSPPIPTSSPPIPTSSPPIPTSSPQIIEHSNKNAEGIYTNLFDTEFKKEIEELTTQDKDRWTQILKKNGEKLNQNNGDGSYFPNFVKITNEDIDINCDNTTTFKFIESYYNAIFNICGFSIQNRTIIMHINIKRGEELKKDKLQINLLYLDNSTVYCAIFAFRFIRRNIPINENDIYRVEDEKINDMVNINIQYIKKLDDLPRLYNFLKEQYNRYNSVEDKRKHPFLRNSFLNKYIIKKGNFVNFEKFKERIERYEYFKKGENENNNNDDKDVGGKKSKQKKITRKYIQKKPKQNKITNKYIRKTSKKTKTRRNRRKSVRRNRR
jgi:hypothetical protein